MKKISATLPALGSYTVPFYEESGRILDFLGDKELSRLSKIAHLGTASAVFTGVNHSRLEYMLLQCAIINLLPKFNRVTEEFAIASKVKLSGGKYNLSSGEELLKCWAILSNMGHAQYTYGVERSLLSYLRRNAKSRNFFLSMIRQAELKKWSQEVIENYKDFDFHWVLAILRISQYLPPRSRSKGAFFQYLVNLLIPLEDLNFKSHGDRYKIYRLRKIFERIRLLSLVTLDSYYSHHPVRYQVSTAIMDLENLFSDQETGFEKLLSITASWLADEIYLHPKSASVLRYYEICSRLKFQNHYGKFFESVEGYKDFMNNFMNNGFGQPRQDHLKVFLRVSLTEQQTALFNGKDTYAIRNLLEKQISKAEKTRISVLKNPFSKVLHVDLLYDVYGAEIKDIGFLCCGFYMWLVRAIKNESNSNLDLLLSGVGEERLPKSFREELKKRFLKQNIESFSEVFCQLVKSVIQYLVPDESSGLVVEFMPSFISKDPFLVDLKIEGYHLNVIKPTLDDSIMKNPFKLHPDRIQELKVLRYAVRYSRFPLLIACAETFIIKTSDGKHVSEWDGILLEISGYHARLNVIEAKNRSTPHQNEKEAFDQLAKCRDYIKSKHKKIETSRTRIAGMGAKLTMKLC